MLQPISSGELDLWEKKLDESNKVCFVPRELLEGILEESEIQAVLHKDHSNADNISYYTQTSAINIRSLNDSYVWTQILRDLDTQDGILVEVGGGTSQVIDLALCFLNFKGTLIKVDHVDWDGRSAVDDLKRPYKVEQLKLDVTTQTDEIPVAHIFVMNHFWDDLYAGMWAASQRADYTEAFYKSVEENSVNWKQALAAQDSIIPDMLHVVSSLAKHISAGGYMVSKSYPSGYETHFKELERINFTFELTNMIIDTLVGAGMHFVPLDIKEYSGPDGAKYPGSFAVLQKG